MSEKEKRFIHGKEEDYMAEVLSLGKRVEVVEKDIGTIKDDQHKIMKSQSNLELVFSSHCEREDEKLGVIYKAIDGIKELCTAITATQNEQAKEMLRIEMKSDYENLRQSKEALEKEIEDRNSGFWGRFKKKFEDRIIDIILYLCLGSGAVFAIYKVLENFITIAPK